MPQDPDMFFPQAVDILEFEACLAQNLKAFREDGFTLGLGSIAYRFPAPSGAAIVGFNDRTQTASPGHGRFLFVHKCACYSR